jgi:glycerophosphoryl diester phosphodiesterase
MQQRDQNKTICAPGSLFRQCACYAGLWCGALLITAVVSSLLLPYGLWLWDRLGISSHADAAAEQPAVLFAHRGGVHLPGVPDNSLKSLETAITQQYGGVEVDVRESRDGVMIAHHDAGFERYFGNSCRDHGYVVCPLRDYKACTTRVKQASQKACYVEHLSAAEIRDLVAEDGESRVPLLEEYIALVAETDMELMLDFKQKLSAHNVDRLTEILTSNFSERTVYFIGKTNPKLQLMRQGQGKFGIIRLLHPYLALFGSSDQVFLFQEGHKAGLRDVLYAKFFGIEFIPSINLQHLGGGQNEENIDDIIYRGHRLLRKFYELGVRKFQIDSHFNQDAQLNVILDIP